MFRRAPIFFYTGVVSSWKKGSAYGFIKDTDSGANFFLHRDDIVDASRNGIKSLPEGFRIEFDKAVFEGRTKAVAVTLRGGAPITSTGEARDDHDDDRDYDRRRGRRDDDDRDDDHEHGRRQREEESRRRKITSTYDRELSRIQGSLAALGRAAVSSFGNSRTNYHGVLSLAGEKNVVVPFAKDTAAKESNAKRWSSYNEKSQELREDAKERRAERIASRRGEQSNQESEPPKGRRGSTIDAEDMF